MEEVVNIHNQELSVWLSSLRGSRPPCTSLGFSWAGAEAWAAPSPSPVLLPFPSASPLPLPLIPVWSGQRGAQPHLLTSSPSPASAAFLSSILPSGIPCPGGAPCPRGTPYLSPLGTLLPSGCPSCWPRGTRRWEGSSFLCKRESKAKGTNDSQSQLWAVGSCPGRTYGAGCGRHWSCYCARCPWKALVLEGAKESDSAARSFSSPGIFSSLSPLVSPDFAFL